MIVVDVVALRQVADGPVADVLVVDAAEEVLQEPFPERPVGHGHAPDAQRLEHRRQDGHATGKDRRSLDPDGVEIQPVDVARFEHPLANLAQAVRRDLLGACLGLGDAADGEHGAGSADRRVPTAGQEDLLDGLEFLPGGALGVFHRASRDCAVREKPVGETDAADEQALHEARLEAPAEDDLGTAPADVDHQARVAVVLQGVGHAEVDEAGFLPAADDLDAVAEGLLGAPDEAAAVARLAQCVGADDADVARREFAQALAETFEAGEGTPRRGRREFMPVAEPFGQAHHLAMLVHDLQPLALVDGDDQVEAVRSQVECRESLFRGVGEWRADLGHGCRIVDGARFGSRR